MLPPMITDIVHGFAGGKFNGGCGTPDVELLGLLFLVQQPDRIRRFFFDGDSADSHPRSSAGGLIYQYP